MNTHTHIWCEQCKRVQPLLVHDLHMDDVTGNYSSALNLQCAECGCVIARLYTAKPGIRALQRRVRYIIE